jgi:hypothetical protein
MLQPAGLTKMRAFRNKWRNDFQTGAQVIDFLAAMRLMAGRGFRAGEGRSRGREGVLQPLRRRDARPEPQPGDLCPRRRCREGIRSFGWPPQEP